MSTKELEKKIISMLKPHGIRSIGIFGSYTRGEAEPSSDIDLLVSFTGSKSLLNLVRIERELSENIGVKVDLLTEQSVSPYLIDSIRKELKVIYR